MFSYRIGKKIGKPYSMIIKGDRWQGFDFCLSGFRLSFWGDRLFICCKKQFFSSFENYKSSFVRTNRSCSPEYRVIEAR